MIAISKNGASTGSTAAEFSRRGPRSGLTDERSNEEQCKRMPSGWISLIFVEDPRSGSDSPLVELTIASTLVHRQAALLLLTKYDARQGNMEKKAIQQESLHTLQCLRCRKRQSWEDLQSCNPATLNLYCTNLRHEPLGSSRLSSQISLRALAHSQFDEDARIIRRRHRCLQLAQSPPSKQSGWVASS